MQPASRTRSKVVTLLQWTPPNCRYDPERVPPFTIWLNLLFSVASLDHSLGAICRAVTDKTQAALFTVANLYYNQPVLDKIAEDFNVSFEKASTVASLMQAGYAIGLFFICPIGDWLRPRPLILVMVGVTATVVMLIASARSIRSKG